MPADQTKVQANQSEARDEIPTEAPPKATWLLFSVDPTAPIAVSPIMRADIHFSQTNINRADATNESSKFKQEKGTMRGILIMRQKEHPVPFLIARKILLLSLALSAPFKSAPVFHNSSQSTRGTCPSPLNSLVAPVS